MSRIGKNPIKIPQGVKIEINNNLVKVTGKLGSLDTEFVNEVKVSVEENEVFVLPSIDVAKLSNKVKSKYKSKWGLSRTLLLNMITGVSQGFTKKLEINGVGYKAAIDKKILTLNLGFSHAIKYLIPEGITIVAEKPTLLTISGIDKQKVGQVAAKIRSFRKPEPYKGKGVKFEDEIIRRKETKSGKK
ncbi:MAG: 50S ribosomal protein L6 [Sphingobacteriia bacterium]|nr:50S ribosomal protein L6 [Sphingobacteriia bacterium]